MSKSSPKKGRIRTDVEKRRHERKSPSKSTVQTNCKNCSKVLEPKASALFVEEEVGRIFCSESCITQYFTPEVDRLEKEYQGQLLHQDLTGNQREALSHLRWLTLQEPDEIWREKTINGDYRYILISEYTPDTEAIWYICICLFLRDEPSFLYLAFPTRHLSMVNFYRRGERVELSRPLSHSPSKKAENSDDGHVLLDGLAEPWTEAETARAQMMSERHKDDIPAEEYGLYQGCLDETLDNPDELWTLQGSQDDERRIFHFIKHYPDETPGIWFIIVARETDDDEQIEIVEAFPTRDHSLLEYYRRGEQEIGRAGGAAAKSSQLVH